jgi:hypothetical protein
MLTSNEVGNVANASGSVENPGMPAIDLKGNE